MRAEVVTVQCDELVEGSLVQRATPALPHGRLIGCEPAGGQLSKDELVCAGHATGCVNVFDAHEPGAAMGAGIQPTGERGHQRAGVQRTGGRGGKAASVRGRGALRKRQVALGA